MPVVHVCPWAEVPVVAKRVRPSHLVSLLDPGDWPETPPEVDPDRHHRVGVHDYAEPQDGVIAPAEEHVRALIDFLRGWDTSAPILIHCFAGVSRSTASALITLALHNPGREVEAAEAIRLQSPAASPNRRILRIADGLLGLDGRLMAALAAMGPARPVYVNKPFEVPLDLWSS
ncbi:MAG: protein-tyrosine phosphatase family protein [Zavarzinia sp.]|nr:protein-tyrosine phosphatase family protein [Zavarzinia sp.]